MFLKLSTLKIFHEATPLRDIAIFHENKENQVSHISRDTGKKFQDFKRPTIKSLRFPGSIDRPNRVNAIMPINHSTLGILSPVL